MQVWLMENPISDHSLYQTKFSPAVPKFTHSQRLNSRSRKLSRNTEKGMTAIPVFMFMFMLIFP
jgi:hypothetical protein